MAFGRRASTSERPLEPQASALGCSRVSSVPLKSYGQLALYSPFHGKLELIPLSCQVTKMIFDSDLLSTESVPLGSVVRRVKRPKVRAAATIYMVVVDLCAKKDTSEADLSQMLCVGEKLQKGYQRDPEMPQRGLFTRADTVACTSKGPSDLAGLCLLEGIPLSSGRLGPCVAFSSWGGEPACLPAAWKG